MLRSQELATAIRGEKDNLMTANVGIHVLKILIAEWAAILVFFCWLYDRHRIADGKRWLTGMLVALAGAATLAYFDFGVFYKYGGFTNPHDLFHYYMGSKYSKEVGTFDLYACAFLADQEENKAYTRPTIRNLHDHTFISTREALDHAAEYKSRFTDARWREFRKDVRYFQTSLSNDKWQRVLWDKGYNATPVWNMVARSLTNRIPTGNAAGMNVLLSLDILLLAAMVALVYTAFGLDTALFAVAVLGTNFMLSFTHSRGALLRFDWFTLLAMAVCLLKLGRYKTAGAFMAYAAAARVFPAIFVFGLGAKWAWDVFYTRGINRRYLGFFAAFAVTLALLVGASALSDGGFSRWGDFAAKIRVHNSDISSTRVGFKYIFLLPFANKQLAFEQSKVVWWAIQAVVLGCSFFLVKRIEDYEAVAFGFVPVFFLTAPTFYYYAMMIVPYFFFAPKTHRISRAVGLAMMFLIFETAFLLRRAMPFGERLFFLISCMLLMQVAYLMGLCLFETLSKRGLDSTGLENLPGSVPAAP